MSLTSATAILKRFYSNYPDSESLTLEQVYISSKRNPAQPEINKAWVANKLTHLKHYGLAEPVYSYEPRKMLTGIRLTYEGKKVIGRIGNTPVQLSIPQASPKNTKVISLETIAQDIKEFSKQNPSVHLHLVIEVNKEVNT